MEKFNKLTKRQKQILKWAKSGEKMVIFHPHRAGLATLKKLAQPPKAINK